MEVHQCSSWATGFTRIRFVRQDVHARTPHLGLRRIASEGRAAVSRYDILPGIVGSVAELSGSFGGINLYLSPPNRGFGGRTGDVAIPEVKMLWTGTLTGRRKFAVQFRG